MNFLVRVGRRIATLIFPAARWVRFGYAQEGEDMLLQALMEDYPPNYKGVYVDVGAHHPFRFSNTYLFYLKGWHGINIDATPGSMRLFRKYRKRDVNLEIGVSAEKGMLTFFSFNEPALNTFSEEVATAVDGKQGYHIIEKVTVKTDKLSSILDAHLPYDTVIDFLSIDAEGMDLVVLRSNDWRRFRPRYVVVEAPANREKSNATMDYLIGLGYRPVASSPRTMIFS